MRKALRHITRIFLVLALVVWTASPADAAFRKRMLPAQYGEQVSALFAQHRWTKGKELLDEGLDLYPNDANLHYLAGRYYWNSKKYPRCRYHLVKAVKINYNHVEAKQMLVNVEEITGNYSSAICYINELLEVNPYWKGLWQRKIELYKKQGNFEEANILLKRLNQIYPNDASLTGDYYDVLETTYKQARQNGDLAAAEETLRSMVEIDPRDTDYQLAYASILIQRGRLDEAVDALKAALNYSPGNVEIIRKIAGILMDTGRDKAALALVRSQKAQNPSGALQQLYNELTEESARMEDEADAYQLYMRAYDRKHSDEALQYLLTQSVKRGYFDDAQLYVNEARTRQGESPRLSMIEYELYNRMNRPEQARRVLEKAERLFPDDYDVNLAACRQRLSEAAEAMADERYPAAISLLEPVRTGCVEEELRHVATRRLAVCYRETGQVDAAAEMLRERMAFDPAYLVTVDYASLLQKQGRSAEALEVLDDAYASADEADAMRALRNAYEETAIPYLKTLMEAGAYPEVQAVCDRMLRQNPASYWGLRYAVQSAADPSDYIETGLSLYPDDIYFQVKKAQQLNRQGRYEESLVLLNALRKEHPGDETLISTYAEASQFLAANLSKAGDYTRAGAVLDSALVLRPTDQELLYARGGVYARLRQWDSAYVYQRQYTPSFLEEPAHKARMDALRNRGYKNIADAGYTFLRFADTYQIAALATVGYARTEGKNNYGLRINYTGRDADVEKLQAKDGTDSLSIVTPGGQGVQFQLKYGRELSDRLSASVSAAWASAYLPKWAFDASATLHLPKDYDLEMMLQYRYLRDIGPISGITANFSHTGEHFLLGGKVTAGLLLKHFYVNGSARARFYPYEGGRTFVEAQAGAGTAPEITIIDLYYNKGSFNHLNSFVSLSAGKLLGPNWAVSSSLTWSTLYRESETVSFRNMFILDINVSVSF